MINNMPAAKGNSCRHIRKAANKMRKGFRRLFLSVLSAVMVTCVSGVSLPVSAQDTRVKQDFSGFTAEREVSEHMEFGNIPPLGHEAQNLYRWTPVRGLWGKSETDTALHFVSKWDSPALPKIENGDTSNPFVNFLIREKDIGDKLIHISFEIARDGGNTGLYLQLRPYADHATKRFEPENIFYISHNSDSDTLKMFGQETGHELKYKRWSKIDFVFYPNYTTEWNGQQGTYTVMDCYIDGDQVQNKKVLDADNTKEGMQVMEGMDFLRVALDPKPENGIYPQTNTYLDNFMYELIDQTPVITKIELSHSNPELNGYIDNTQRVIEGHGQTVEEMINGLSANTQAEFVFVDKSGAKVTQGNVSGNYLQVTNKADGTQTFYTIINCGSYIKNSDYTIDYEQRRISGLYLYTPVSMLKKGIELYPACSMKIIDKTGTEAADTADIRNDMKLIVTKEGEAETEEYTLNVFGKALDYNFNSWDTKLYYEESNDWYDGVKFSGPKLADGIDPSKTAYIETVKEEGRGMVLHSYVNSDYGTNFHHMNLLLQSQPLKEQIGARFVMELSVKAGENSGIGSQAKYLTKQGGAENFINPIQFSNGNISVMNTIVSTYQPDKWYDVKAYCDTAKSADNLVVYINGAEAFSGTSTTVADFKQFTEIRLLQHFFKENVIQEAWMDDFRVYGVGGLTESFLSTMKTGLRSDVYTVDGNMIHGYSKMTAKELKDGAVLTPGESIEIYEADGETPVEESRSVKQGMMVRVISSDASSFRNYILGIADYAVGQIQYYVNGNATDHRFAEGKLRAQVHITCYTQTPVPVMLAIAQYRDNQLIGIKAVQEMVQGTGGEDKTVSLTQDITQAQGSIIKILLWNQAQAMYPLQPSVTLVPFSNEQIEDVSYFYPGYTQKAVTFSYDDCVAQDEKLIRLFNAAGIRGTFNLQTNKFFGQSEAVRKEIKERYQNQEIATHTRTHPRMYLTQPTEISGTIYQPLTLEECEADMQNGVDDIQDLFGINTEGMAWPYNRPNGRADFEQIMEFIKKQGIRYIRGVQESGAFELPNDWLDWHPTCHHDSAKNKVEQFMALNEDGNLKVCYIWGHAYELDESYKPEEVNKLRWNGMEEIVNQIGNAQKNSEVWVPTNIELVKYVEAIRSLKVDYENNQITNPSDETVYVKINGKNVEIKPGGIGKL